MKFWTAPKPVGEVVIRWLPTGYYYITRYRKKWCDVKVSRSKYFDSYKECLESAKAAAAEKGFEICHEVPTKKGQSIYL